MLKEIEVSKESLGTLIKTRRESLGWSQRQLAEQVNLDSAYIGRLELGKQLGSVESLVIIAKALGLRPGLLMDTLADFQDTDQQKAEQQFLPLPEVFGPEQRAKVVDYIKLLEKEVVMAKENASLREQLRRQAEAQVRAQQEAEVARKQQASQEQASKVSKTR